MYLATNGVDPKSHPIKRELVSNNLLPLPHLYAFDMSVPMSTYVGKSAKDDAEGKGCQ